MLSVMESLPRSCSCKIATVVKPFVFEPICTTEYNDTHHARVEACGNISLILWLIDGRIWLYSAIFSYMASDPDSARPPLAAAASATDPNPPTPRRLHTVSASQIEALADVLIDCVEGGASVSFMLPLSRGTATSFWQHVAIDVANGHRALIVAEDARGICGTVQLILDQPENQPHRADLSKMLVHRRARRRGLGEALMQAAEATARECGKTLLVLDTANGTAERLYERLGWARVGVVPNFALLPDGAPCDTTFFYRELSK